MYGQGQIFLTCPRSCVFTQHKEPIDGYQFFMISWWRHQMETFSVLLALCEGNPPVTGGFPSQRPVTRSFDIFFYLRLDGDLKRHHAHCDVTVMFITLTRSMLQVVEHQFKWPWSRSKPGPRLNIKTVLSTYGNFHVKDKTAVRTSYL